MCLRRVAANSSAVSRESSAHCPSSPQDNVEPLRPQAESRRIRRSFSVVAHVVTAAKKFQASLNPTISFRKRNSEEDYPSATPYRVLSEAAAASPPPRLLSFRSFSGGSPSFKRTPSGRLVPRSTYERRGHMTGYLLMPLPELKASS